MTYHPQNPYATGRKPEPSMLTRGRAKAKGLNLAYVSPRLSAAYVMDKLRQSGWAGDLRSTATPAPADDLAVALPPPTLASSSHEQLMRQLGFRP